MDGAAPVPPSTGGGGGARPPKRRRLTPKDAAYWDAAAECKRLQREWKSSRDLIYQRQLAELLEQLVSNERTGGGPQLRNMSPSGLNMVAGAAAAVLEKKAPAPFVQLLATTVVAALPRCAARQTANLLWALAKLDPHLHPERVSAAGDGWLEALGARATQLHGDMNAIDLANTLWALGTWRCAPANVDVARLAERLSALSAEAGPQNLSNTLWALARLHEAGSWQADDQAQVVTALAAALEERAAAAKPQALSNALWALATMWGGESDGSGQMPGAERERLLQRLALSFARVLHKANSQTVANVVWAAGRLCSVTWPPELLQGVEHVLEQLQPSSAARWEPLDVSQLLWGCCRLRWRPSDAAAAPLLRHFEAHLLQYNSQTVANTLHAVASLQLSVSGTVVSAALRRLVALVEDGQCDVQHACNALWAAAALQVYDAPAAELLVAWLEPQTRSLLVEHQVQLVQAHLAFALCPDAAERVELLPAPLLAVCKEGVFACNTSSSQQAVTRFQKDVLRVVRSLRAPNRALFFDDVRGEQLLEGGLFVADVLAQHSTSSQRMIFEADGPSHFAANRPDIVLGATCMRDRLLRAHGYVVVGVPHFEWAPLQGDKQKLCYLQDMLECPPVPLR